jgi:hypothetical protein
MNLQVIDKYAIKSCKKIWSPNKIIIKGVAYE